LARRGLRCRRCRRSSRRSVRGLWLLQQLQQRLLLRYVRPVCLPKPVSLSVGTPLDSHMSRSGAGRFRRGRGARRDLRATGALVSIDLKCGRTYTFEHTRRGNYVRRRQIVQRRNLTNLS
jgi:hypothetical protein